MYPFERDVFFTEQKPHSQMESFVKDKDSFSTKKEKTLNSANLTGKQ